MALWKTEALRQTNWIQMASLNKMFCCFQRFLFWFFNRFGWGRTALLYETPAFNSVIGGITSGYLLASNIHEFLIAEGMETLGRELQLQNSLHDQLLQTVGNNYGSEFWFGHRVLFLWSLVIVGFSHFWHFALHYNFTAQKLKFFLRKGREDVKVQKFNGL